MEKGHRLTRRQFIKRTGGTLAAAFVPVIAGQKSKRKGQQGKPNIIFLMADDLGFGDVGFNGNKHIKTPNLDKMASQGTVLDRFYAAAPLCSPTRGSCLTGR